MTSVAEQKHVSVVITGHVDSGKSTTTGHLIFELGGINDREMQKLKEEADRLGKSSFAFAFYMDRQKEERERGVTISCTTKEFFTRGTNKYHYTIVDAPGHRDFVKNMISGASQADVAVLMVPADGNFATSIAKGGKDEVKGQTREHARLLNLLGIKQLIVCVNKMDDKSVNFSEERFNEIKDEIKNMLIRVGWPKMQVEKCVPIIPLSGYRGDNLLTKSDNMPWWGGCDVLSGKDGPSFHIETLHDALDEFIQIPERDDSGPLRMSVSDCLKIKGVGDVICGQIVSGSIVPNTEVKFIPTDSASNKCRGKVFSIEMHKRSVPRAGPGDNVGLNVKGLDKGNMPRKGDVMILVKDDTLKQVKSFTCQVQLLDIPGDGLKVKYTPTIFCKTARAACKLTKINWKMGKETGGKKLEGAQILKSNEMAELEFEPQQPIIVDTFSNSPPYARIAIFEGLGAAMLGKVINVEHV